MGNHLTDNWSGRGSPITSFFVRAAGPVVCDNGEVEYAAPESITPESWGWRWCFGVLCNSRLRCVETCKWLNCNVPARANIRGTYSCWNSAGRGLLL